MFTISIQVGVVYEANLDVGYMYKNDAMSLK